MTLTPWRSEFLAGADELPESCTRRWHFVHGNGFCGRTLTPVANQLQALLTGEVGAGGDHADGFLFTDLPGHGDAPPAPEQAQRRMPDWIAMADHLADSVAGRGRAPLIGVGHSMGGVVTLLAAARHPGLFERIVLLDPVLFSSEVLLFQRMMRLTGWWTKTGLVKSVSARRARWPDRATAREELSRKSLYRQWRTDALDAFVQHGLKPVLDDDSQPTEEVMLSCDPEWEAAIFGSYPKGLWQAVQEVSCRVDIMVACSSYPFIKRSTAKAARMNSLIKVHPIDGSHCFPMEAPETAARWIRDLCQ